MTDSSLPHVPLSGLKPGDRVDSVYLLTAVERRQKKNGEPFFMLEVTDASGSLSGVIWDNHETLDDGRTSRDDFVHVQGDIGEYNGRLQMTMRRVSRVPDEEVDKSAFLPVSPRPREDMERELDEWIARVEHPDCRKLLNKVFGHERLRELYCTAPAAVQIHEAYIHGLLEHTLKVMRIADAFAGVHPPVHRDVLITGTLLHDIGKIRELKWDRSLTYTSHGRLLGHISMGASMVDALINELRKHEDFDREVQAHILHLLLSHHGKLEWGSPVVPKTKEALILHYADHAEAYLASFERETADAAQAGDQWTKFSRLFESYLFAGPINGATTNGFSETSDVPPGPNPILDDVNPPS